MYTIRLFTLLLLVTFNVQAEPNAPVLRVNTEGLQLRLNWSTVEGAVGYRLFYTTYPFQGLDTISDIDVQAATELQFELPQGMAAYVAIQAYDVNRQHSDFSNIGFFQIQDRGLAYREYWRTVAADISHATFTSNDFLYAQLPDVAACIAGESSDRAQERYLDVLNQIRKLHAITAVTYDMSASDMEQQAALIQRANNTLSHSPASSVACYSQIGFDGSQSSNLHLGSKNSDPADDLIGLVDDAFNLAAVAGVGHRRALLNPFMSFSSYGQVFGASASKVVNFSQDVTSDPATIPDFIAFPYLRYPYLFFSDKTKQRSTPWNLTIIEDKVSFWANQHDYFTSAKLAVTQKDTGQVMRISNMHADTKASGVPNNLSWTVDDWQYDTWYTVTVDNLHYVSGEVRSIQYDVFIDYKNIIDITAPLELGDQQNGLAMQGSLSDVNDKDSYAVTLAGEVSFSGSSQFANMAFYIAVYDANKLLVAANDEAFTLDLPAGEYTLVVANCFEQTCYTDPKSYSVQVD
jgi:hypothetical protein